jgi:hypothetical protein
MKHRNTRLFAICLSVSFFASLSLWVAAMTVTKTNNRGMTSLRQALIVTPAGIPQYQIYDIGVVQVGDTASQGFGVSRAGIAVGRSFQADGTQAFTWTLNSGIVGLPICQAAVTAFPIARMTAVSSLAPAQPRHLAQAGYR